MPELGTLPTEEPEARLLSVAAGLSLCLKAGWSPESNPPEVPKACPHETRPVALNSETHLFQCFDISSGLVDEWIAECLAVGSVAPPAVLPRLLDRFARQSSFDRDLLKLLGERGRWLAQFNDQWRILFEPPDAEVWQEGSLAERVSFLSKERGEAPSDGRERLQSIWNVEPAKGRAALLDTLRAGLSSDDLPFLESALSDRSVEVRRVAIDLLSQIPSSSVARKARELALEWVQTSRSLLGSKLIVDLPPETEDLFDDLDQPVPDAGKRAAKLARVAGCVPVSQWESGLEKSLQDLLTLAARNDNGPILRQGWEFSAVRFRDSGAAETLLTRWSEHPPGPPSTDLINLLNKQALDRFRVQQLRAKSAHVAVFLRHPEPWSIETSKLVLETYLRGEIASVQAMPAAEVASRLHTDVADIALNAVPEDQNSAFRSWNQILPLRKDMIRTIRRSQRP
jgi:hypothetical protein